MLAGCQLTTPQENACAAYVELRMMALCERIPASPSPPHHLTTPHENACAAYVELSMMALCEQIPASPQPASQVVLSRMQLG